MAGGCRSESAWLWATLVAVKPFLVPLVLWLVLTRRFRAAAIAVVSAAALILLPWAVIGFDGFLDYPRLVDRVESENGPGTESRRLLRCRGSRRATPRARSCAVLQALALVAVAVRLRRGPAGDLRVFAILIGVSVLATPTVWPHYVALLFVPLAHRAPSYRAPPGSSSMRCGRFSRSTTAFSGAWMFLVLMLAVMAVPLLQASGGHHLTIRPRHPPGVAERFG